MLWQHVTLYDTHYDPSCHTSNINQNCTEVNPYQTCMFVKYCFASFLIGRNTLLREIGSKIIIKNMSFNENTLLCKHLAKNKRCDKVLRTQAFLSHHAQNKTTRLDNRAVH